jgi:ubiquinone/menaquinone biosynthesis C-methylase UbiE
VTLYDLSPPYLAAAKSSLGPKYPQLKYTQGAAEDMPYEDASFDAITCVYLFHELPAEVRKKVVREMSRVLRPGGKVFFGMT